MGCSVCLQKSGPCFHKGPACADLRDLRGTDFWCHMAHPTLFPCLQGLNLGCHEAATDTNACRHLPSLTRLNLRTVTLLSGNDFWALTSEQL